MMDAASAENCLSVVLMYHRVAEFEPDEWGLCISPQTFREHMTEIKRSAHPMLLRDLGVARETGQLPSRAVAVTLDDGCIDNLHTASMILAELELPATFFIPTERLDEEHEYWWDTLERIFSSAQTLPPGLDLSAELGETFNTPIQTDRREAHRAIAQHIRGLDCRERDAMMARIGDWSGIDLTPRQTHRPMTAREVHELGYRPGHEIGAHSVHHLSLPSLSPEAQRREMVENKAALEHLLGLPVTSFAYPYGHADSHTLALATELFSVAVTTRPACVSGIDHRSALPRFDASRLTRTDLMRILESAFS